ncbi:phage major capsid protein, HK97 family [Paenibacillus sp. UNC496MF]|uniref:phage major capsid protein n=1 Tax=Paenibacillus sp. UNC496MF TaxID=1502753 RepID=UPI0008E3D075|nr:phage major capsid protein [Paenibacillus sp. UNC496MF]SFJ62341.1 phage major capsid protein, HK97 family [Paenibacillus sp. UNC496MF]
MFNVNDLKLNEQSMSVLKRMQRQLNVSEDWTQIPKNELVSVKEALTTQDASILIPRVITGMMREAAEPMYIGSQLLQTVRLTEGRSIEFPSIGAMRAHDIGESQSYLEETVDFQLHRTQEVKVGKSGMVVRVTDEMINDSQWDVIGILVRKAGEAMARLKEEKIFIQFSKHGHIVYDNDIRQKYPEAGTTGRDIDGNMNNTMSTEDMIDLFIAVMMNGFNPTDIIMHPLTWSVFFKNDLIHSLSHAALGGSQVTNLSISPETVQGRIPFAININFTPFAPFNFDTKKFDMYVVDRNNIGILLVKDPLSTEQFDDPMRDIQTIKVKERYGIGVLNEGKAVATARNLAFARSYPTPDRIKIVS